MAEREVPRYLPRSFYIKWTSSSSRNIAFIVDLDSFCFRQKSRAFPEEHLSFVSTTQFHLRKLSNGGNSKDITFRAFTN